MKHALRLSALSVLSAASILAACAGNPSRVVEVPSAIAAAAHQTLTMTVAATGVQIYECSVANGKPQPQWTFVAPEATLFDQDGHAVGQHGAGPHWTFEDGTRLTARVAAHAEAPQSGAIPWLLLDSRTTSPNGPLNRFNDVRSIQRINTRGGAAPSDGCRPQDVGSRVRVPYSADYLFYGGAR